MRVRTWQVFNAVIDGDGVWMDSQPDSSRPARAHAATLQPAGPEPSLKPAEALVSVPDSPGLDDASVEAVKSPVEKPCRKNLKAAAKAAAKLECLISNPPKLPPNLEQVAREVSKPLASDSGSVGLNLEDQRILKQKLEAEAMEKKQLAAEKKQKATVLAVEKAENIESSPGKSCANPEAPSCPLWPSWCQTKSPARVPGSSRIHTSC